VNALYQRTNFRSHCVGYLVGDTIREDFSSFKLHEGIVRPIRLINSYFFPAAIAELSKPAA
jgi:hypothetical protein